MVTIYVLRQIENLEAGKTYLVENNYAHRLIEEGAAVLSQAITDDRMLRPKGGKGRKGYKTK